MASILRTTSEHEDFRALVRLLDADLNDRYGSLQAEYDRHNVVDDLQTVVVAYVDRQPVGCGALRPCDRETVEVKRMYVRPAFRGQGIGGRILRELEAWAGELGLSRVILETGRRQHAAIGLYLKHGYRRIENYGPYVDQPMSVCYEKTLGLSREDRMPAIDVVIKSVPQMRVVALRVTSDGPFEPLFRETREQVTAFAAEHNLAASGPLMGVFYEDPTDPDCDSDFAIAFPTESPVQAGGPVEVLTLPAVETMVTCIIPGSCGADEADQVYEQFIAWIAEHGYRIDGPYRELFCPCGEGAYASQPVVEVQFPITCMD